MVFVLAEPESRDGFAEDTFVIHGNNSCTLFEEAVLVELQLLSSVDL